MTLIDQFPKERLTREDEAVCCQKDPQKLVMHSMREAILYTQRCCRDRIPEDERVSICYQKLTACVNRFQPGGIRFFSFAKAGLRGAMKDYWTAQNTIRNATEMVSVDALDGWRGPQNVAGHRAHPRRSSRFASPVPPEIEDGCADSPRERYTGEITMPDTEGIAFRDRWAEIKTLVWPRLNDRQQMVLELVYESGLNFPQIGKMLDVTRSLVHSIHRDTLKLIRSILAADGRLLEE